MIGPIRSVNYTFPSSGISPVGSAAQPVTKVSGVTPVSPKATQSVEKTQPSECQTCKSRKYMDRSNDSNVSFQTPTHISPEASFGAVSAHEQEHVSNAYSKGNREGSRLISASVTLKMEVCPECGTPYVAGGTTRSQIAYNESNPYEQERKAVEGSLLKGMNVDYVA